MIFKSIRSFIFWKNEVWNLAVSKIIPRHQTFMMKGLCQVMKLVWLFEFFLSWEFQLKDRFLSQQGTYTCPCNLCEHPSYYSLRGNWGNRFDKFRNHPNDISFSRWVDFDTSPFLKSSKIPMGQIYRGPLYTLPNLNCISCIHCPVFLFYNSLWLFYIHRVRKAQSNHGGPYPKTGQMGKWSLRQNFINILPVLY